MNKTLACGLCFRVVKCPPFVFYHSVIHGLGFLICYITYIYTRFKKNIAVSEIYIYVFFPITVHAYE